MPLAEFLSMPEDKVDAMQERATNADHHSRPENDFAELVWENGQIMMQGQSSKARRGLSTSDYQVVVTKPQESRDYNGSRFTKFSAMDSVLADFGMSVPSCDMGLNQDAEMEPWLGYADDPLHNDYTCDFLTELSGVTINNSSTENHVGFREKKSGFHDDGHVDFASLKQGDASRQATNTEKFAKSESRDTPQFPLPLQHDVPRTGVSGITGDNVGNASHVDYRDSSLCEFFSLRLQKLYGEQPSTSSGLTNFPCFSRPGALARISQGTVNTSKGIEVEQRCTVTSSYPTNSTVVNLGGGSSRMETVSHKQSALAPVTEFLETLPTKPNEEIHSANQAIRREDIANKGDQQNEASNAVISKPGMDGDKNREPVVAASSVCSGNSVERASNEPAHNLKRKSRETTESDEPSEEVEDESVGVKKAAHNRAGSKRGRAAEVHNLSERRRRDRINEKMRSLQELIPNCNKVDKASMLDEAIEYLKTLQLQVQMLSMGAGMYMQPMMLPPGMQSIHGGQMPHFSPMGLGMGMGMGFGMSMLDLNSGMKMHPFQGPHYPVPGVVPSFHGMSGPSFQAYGHPGQRLPMSMQQAPVHQVSGAPPVNIPMGLNVSGVGAAKHAPPSAPSMSFQTAGPQAVPSNNLNSSMNQATNQISNAGMLPSASSQDQTAAVNASRTSVAADQTDNIR